MLVCNTKDSEARNQSSSFLEDVSVCLMAFWKTGRCDPAAGRRNDFAHIKPYYHIFAKKMYLFVNTEIRQSAAGFLYFPRTDVKLSYVVPV